MKCISVAVDGPAGAGKSTVSRAAAKRLGFVYIDTGAMYRAVALFSLENGIGVNELADKLDLINIEIKHSGGEQLIYLNGTDVSKRIRGEDVSVRASDVAAIKAVRTKLVEMQKQTALAANVIMDGRDIGTCVLPNADLKVFLTASSDTRARRRCKELTERGEKCDFEKIKADIEYRDKNDSERAESPLKRADDAVLLDTSDYTFEESVDALTGMIQRVVENSK
ncbi:MAG: (d)CMP kinase [Firmicutes bacterium]|nr:(d)CMP kinase [Bacillota bacterium]